MSMWILTAAFLVLLAPHSSATQWARLTLQDSSNLVLTAAKTTAGTPLTLSTFTNTDTQRYNLLGYAQILSDGTVTSLPSKLQLKAQPPGTQALCLGVANLHVTDYTSAPVMLQPCNGSQALTFQWVGGQVRTLGLAQGDWCLGGSATAGSGQPVELLGCASGPHLKSWLFGWPSLKGAPVVTQSLMLKSKPTASVYTFVKSGYDTQLAMKGQCVGVGNAFDVTPALRSCSDANTWWRFVRLDNKVGRWETAFTGDTSCLGLNGTVWSIQACFGGPTQTFLNPK